MDDWDDFGSSEPDESPIREAPTWTLSVAADFLERYDDDVAGAMESLEADLRAAYPDALVSVRRFGADHVKSIYPVQRMKASLPLGTVQATTASGDVFEGSVDVRWRDGTVVTNAWPRDPETGWGC